MFRPLLDDARLSSWIDRTGLPAEAAACVRYALAFNTLDPGWLANALADQVTYDSQHAFGTLRGQRRVFEYLRGKILTLREDPSVQPRFELAVTELGDCCAAGFQPMGAFDRNWLDTPLINVVFTVNPVGLIESILIITVAPSPAGADRSGIYPGVVENDGERPRKLLLPTTDYQGLQFVFFLLDDVIALDRRMRQVAEQTLARFPGAESRFVVSTRMTDTDNDAIARAQISGFPSVAVYFRGEAVCRQQGLISAETLTSMVSDATTLCVTSPPPGAPTPEPQS